MPEDQDFSKGRNNPNKSFHSKASSNEVPSAPLSWRVSQGQPPLYPSTKSRDFKVYSLGSLNPPVIVYKPIPRSLPPVLTPSSAQTVAHSPAREEQVAAAIPLFDADDKITAVVFDDEEPKTDLAPPGILTDASIISTVITEPLVPTATSLDNLGSTRDSVQVNHADPDESTPRFAEDCSSVDSLTADSSETEKQEISLAELVETGSLSDDDSLDAYVIMSAELERQIFESSITAINSAKTLGDTHGDIYNNLTGLRNIQAITIVDAEFLNFKHEVTALREQMSTGAVLIPASANAVMSIIDKTIVHNSSRGPVCVRYNGDQECDRGLHDGLNILFIKFLKEQRNLHPRILFSNHGDSFLKYAREFIKASYKIPRHWAEWESTYKASIISFVRLCESIEREDTGIDATGSSESKSFFRDLLEYYLKEIYSKVYLLDYSELSNSQLVIYSHAPICHRIILDAHKILVQPEISKSDPQEQRSEQEMLKTAIKEINAKFQELLQRHIDGIFSDMPDKQFDLHEYLNRPENIPLLAIVWRRLSWPEQYMSITKKYHSDTSFPDFIYRNVHGHDSPLPVNLAGVYVAPKLVNEPLYFGQKSYCINAEYFTAPPEAMGDAGHCNSFDPAAAEKLIEEKKQIPDLGVAPWLQGLYQSIAVPVPVSAVRQTLTFASRTRWRPLAAEKRVTHQPKVEQQLEFRGFDDSSNSGLDEAADEQAMHVCSVKA